jgi:tetratricopeptide (TPR) repeat protein
MATENQKFAPKEKTSELPSDNELFATEVCEQPSDSEIFVGDKDFFKQLTKLDEPPAAKRPAGIRPDGIRPAGIRRILPALIRQRFSTTQKILIVGIVATVAVLLYALLKSPSGPVALQPPTPTGKIPPGSEQVPSPKPPAEDFTKGRQQQTQELQPALSPTLPLSLRVAETFYREGSYDKAFAAYNQLRQALPIGPQEELLRDFLQLRMALCTKKAADFDQANRLLRTVLQSRSPIVRTIANYHLGLLEMQKKQYFKARTRAYQTIALINAVTAGGDWVVPLRRDCHFLAAESITRKAFSLCAADKDIPPNLWGDRTEVEPFTSISDTELRPFLNSGSEQLSKGLLAPQVQKLANPDTPGPPRWSVICHGASIEELLTRFAANADLDIHWTSGPNSVGIRTRPVSLYLPATTTEQFAKVAAGCVGLSARLDENNIVNVSNPVDYSSSSEHVSLLIEEAISLWQRFLLTYYDDKRIPNAHFALGLLKAEKDQVIDAIAEYKLVANRFSNTPLAPFALLNSSKLKTNLRDYLGARNDLEQLIERDPDTEIANHAYLYLADATMKSGRQAEAARLYQKVYNLGFSLESQANAALGAGRCSYKMKDFQSAAKWLTHYVGLAKDHVSKDLYSACLLLGKSHLALGRHQQACDAFQYALAGQLSPEEYVEAVSALVEAHSTLGNFIEALDVLENVQPWELSEKESIEMLLLKSAVLRKIGLIDRATVALRNRAEYISEPHLITKIFFELAKCHIAEGNFKLARGGLAEILVNVDPGPLAHEIAVTLAEVCLKLGQDSQAQSVCLQILNLNPSAQIKQEVLNILATAYNRQKNYDKAALALSGQWNEAETQSEKTMLDDAAGADKSPTRTK